jgi:hypothetical protein
LRARSFGAQQTEVAIGCSVLNGMGTPEIRLLHWNHLMNDGIKDHNPQNSRSLH